ncbi:hypothetical protein GCM10011579_048660 [Streptomyces albiflavescens]|uniref:Secreted protein n=1 Tax=Streptomyces albiflavescens TaxID=1623582 RepID=A0A917Y5X1_9ACTN|nr:hypothetical protein [Streptomyces albiflavescens]GGN71923.1 hypothetical protein GCM10011579_048660 [Streptomyces albiflavescens]
MVLAGAVLVSSAAVATATPAAAAGCGRPQLKVWYDSDQFGTYLKAWFKSPAGCRTQVFSLKGQIYCGDPVKKVYDKTTSGRAPVETETKALPPKSKCKKFVATAKIVYYPDVDFTDTWTWKWGDYPA